MKPPAGLHLKSYDAPLLLRHHLTRGNFDHVGSAASLGCRDIPHGGSAPQVYHTGPGSWMATSCFNSNFPNRFYTLTRTP